MKENLNTNHFYINGNVWGIRIVDIIENDNDCSGICYGHKKEILIQKGNSEEYTKEVICHELIHAYMREYLIHDSVEDKIFNEEEICNFISKYLMKMFKTFNEVVGFYWNE